ncbi:inorganic pyrophosphatase 2-like [Wolffia australiana]
MASAVVVFDFDKTIIDCDSDNWVVEALGADDLFNLLLPTMPWNSLMDHMMAELHAMGKSIEDISRVLKAAPIHPSVVTCIKSAHALGCELRIVSDANALFIETILEHHGLLGFFSEIATNPSYVDEEGRLRILPYHDFNKSDHGCPLCPPNMCKGKIIEGAIQREERKIIYLGDGKGDYCPSLRLREVDFFMPRKDFPCWELICEDPSALKSQVLEWRYGEEQGELLLEVITIIVQQPASGECKLESIPPAVPTYKSLGRALALRP